LEFQRWTSLSILRSNVFCRVSDVKNKRWVCQSLIWYLIFNI
jgi:hypothetical protein